MVALSVNAYYRENQITTVSPGELLLLAYDGAIRFLAEGKRAMAEKRYEEQNTHLTRAQALILELARTLDHTVNPELAGNLDRLYTYMLDRLVQANIDDDEAALTEVTKLLTALREAWELANKSSRPTVRGGIG